ncbi:TldD/PmbA family protein [Methanobacterium paludis]|uniref:Peptidase U62 modulator of DNA gyrase n=1 Tax=Methanobacterium paludis (strain DSM 25820 / JCM 18151 / SWAN1) TaxID=868131 RepID=F6D643_METPW|nr:TldD/PmbA family protein [Methanobacterium paludis]AEG17691.1 peptidase U62 modulator of DNA gyrase [Methanobacterium paludis]
MTEDELDLDLLKKTITSLEKRADYTDIRVNESYNTAIIMKDSKIQEIRSGSDLGGCIRVLKGGAWGFAFTNQISKIGEAAESALKLANSLQSDVELSDARPEVDTVKCLAKLKPSDVSMDEKKEIMSDADSAAKIPKVVSTTVNYVDTEGTTTFLNSEGSFLTIEESRVAMFLNAVASDEGIIQFGHKSIGGAKGFEAVKNEDIEKFGRTAASKAVRLLKANSPPSGSFPVVLDSELTGVFIHEALGHATEADLILQNDSILKGKMGTQIGSKLVTIVDDASMDAFGYYPYDAEGVKTRENVLVKDGTLVSLMSSRETASKLGITPSGNARSAVGEQPIVRMSNTYLKPGDQTFDELVEGMKTGIYLKGSRGGQVDTGKGIFQFNAAESFMIENGEVKEPLRDVSLSGNILEMLNHVDAVGSDFKLGVGFCGKSGQTVPVGDGGPHVRVTRAMVGGAM